MVECADLSVAEWPYYPTAWFLTAAPLMVMTEPLLHGPCHATLHKAGLTTSEICECIKKFIVDASPAVKFHNGLPKLHEVDDAINFVQQNHSQNNKPLYVYCIMLPPWHHRLVLWNYSPHNNSTQHRHISYTYSVKITLYITQFSRYLASNIITSWRHHWCHKAWIRLSMWM